MDESRRKLIIDGNAFYELDMDCLEKKRQAAPPRETAEPEGWRARKKRRQRR